MKSKWRGLIGWYELIGGGLGLALTLLAMVRNAINLSIRLGQMPAFYVIFTIGVLLISTVVYLLATTGGFYLVRKDRRGLLPSIIAQVFQIPCIAFGGFSYNLVAGLQLGGAFAADGQSAGGNMLFYIGSHFNITYTPGRSLLVLGFNIVPILVVAYLLRLRSQKQETEAEQPEHTESVEEASPEADSERAEAECAEQCGTQTDSEAEAPGDADGR